VRHSLGAAGRAIFRLRTPGLASAGRIPDGVLSVAQLSQNSQPRLARGCRWATHEGQPVVLFPEGMIRLQGTGQTIMELCDGRRTIQEIVTTLSERYSAADPAKISDDVYGFLASLQEKRIVDFE